MLRNRRSPFDFGITIWKPYHQLIFISPFDYHHLRYHHLTPCRFMWHVHIWVSMPLPIFAQVNNLNLGNHNYRHWIMIYHHFNVNRKLNSWISNSFPLILPYPVVFRRFHLIWPRFRIPFDLSTLNVHPCTPWNTWHEMKKGFGISYWWKISGFQMINGRITCGLI